MHSYKFLILIIMFTNSNLFSYEEGKALNQDIANPSGENSTGIYLRDDHCDWGSSGMNEFTNEYNSN